MTLMPSLFIRAVMSRDWAWARLVIRSYRRAALTVAAVEQRHRVRGLDQRLGRHAVGEDAGAAEPVGVDDGDVGAELGGDQSGLVTAGAAAEDRDSLTWQGHDR
jgi:hypothetical protein